MEANLILNVVETEEEFYSLRSEWEALIARAEQISIFVSWEWQYYWWRHYGKEQKLRLVIARAGDRVVGILPLYIRTIRLLRVVSVKLLQFVGTGGDTSPEYLGPIIDPKVSVKVIDELVCHVFNSMRGWDVLSLSEISASSDFHNTLIKLCTAMRLAYNAYNLNPNAYIALPDNWEDFVCSLSSKRRYKMRRMRRRFEEVAGNRFFVWTDESQLQSAIERLIALHHMRWSGSGEYSFSSPEYIGFHTNLMHVLMKKGCLRLYCLEAEGKIIAMDYCYRWNGEIMGFQRGFDPAYEKLSPGNVLLGYQIEHAIGEQNHSFDFLKGDHEYKRYVAKNTREKVAINSFKSNLASALYRTRTEYIPELKKLVQKKLSGFGTVDFRKIKELLPLTVRSKDGINKI
jgi:CelD/BcsL family acetyltransferase involved in cellulose biosynthesis